ncbi:MAG TPA: DNA repair protein RecO [Verrucomicrobiae bacterium]|nr:DNA repair protein RecO [Verrucomicrobiae bacterium]
METERADGIVLRKQPVTESSLIVTWYTREFGKLKTLAKGARRPKGPFQGKIDLFYHDEIVFLPSRRSDLHLLHDCFLETPHKRLRESMDSLAAASYACELVDLATEPEDPNAKVFELLAAILNALEHRTSSVLLIWFELQLLAAVGWAPKLESTTTVSKVLRSLASAGLNGVKRVKLTAEQTRAVQQALWAFWDGQLDRAPRSRKLIAGLTS